MVECSPLKSGGYDIPFNLQKCRIKDMWHFSFYGKARSRPVIQLVLFITHETQCGSLIAGMVKATQCLAKKIWLLFFLHFLLVCHVICWSQEVIDPILQFAEVCLTKHCEILDQYLQLKLKVCGVFWFHSRGKKCIN